MIKDDSCESGMRNWETGDAICQTRQWRRSQVSMRYLRDI